MDVPPLQGFMEQCCIPMALPWAVALRAFGAKKGISHVNKSCGEKIVHALSGKLAVEFGRGFTRRNLFNMVRFAEVFPEPQIVHAVRAQLSWTHLRRIGRVIFAEKNNLKNLAHPGREWHFGRKTEENNGYKHER